MSDWQLGDWVEFDVVVGKTATDGGTEPAAVNLSRTRRGMVVGQRKVYAVRAGMPPVLSHPRPVLLVAVSLGRLYRVFPGDVRPAAPPRSRGWRTSATTTTAKREAAMVGPPSSQTVLDVVQAALATRDGRGRAAVTSEQLALLIASEINQLMVARQWFSAYAVTLRLRAAFPDLDFEHSAVRPLVHVQMEALVAAGLYDRENATYGQATALRYVPV